MPTKEVIIDHKLAGVNQHISKTSAPPFQPELIQD